MEDIMKKKMAAFLAVSMLLCGQALAADFSNLVIIHTNDTHGFDRRAEGINGMATVSALRKHYLSQGKDVLLVDAGDAIQDNNLVNFSKGKSAIAFMNAALVMMLWHWAIMNLITGRRFWQSVSGRRSFPCFLPMSL